MPIRRSQIVPTNLSRKSSADSATERNGPTRKVAIARNAQGRLVRRDDVDVMSKYGGTGTPVPWPEMRRQIAEDLQPGSRDAGIHVGVIAPTRQGKTTLVQKGIIPIYTAADIPVLVIDSTGDPKLEKYGERMPRIGKMTEIHSIHVNDLSRDSKLKIYNALNRAYKQGDILIYADEVRHLADPRFFGLGGAMDNIWIFGGKRGVVMTGSTQAPRFVPSNFYDQSQAHFLFKIRDMRARKRLAEIGGDTARLMDLSYDLPRYHFSYVNPDGDIVVSKLKL